MQRAALAERMRLMPTSKTLSHVARGTGRPLRTPLWWSAPGERALRDNG